MLTENGHRERPLRQEVGHRELYLTRPYLRGPDVLAVQRRLKELGFDPYGLDGIFGPMTEQAVMAFQRSRGMTPDGVVRERTYRALGFSPVRPTPPAPGGPWGRPGDVSILIDTAARRLHVFSGRRRIRVWPCAVGKPSTPTPVGRWEIVTKVVDPDWKVLGTRWMGLDIPTGNYGIHGTNNPASIGHAVSNGCVRLHNRHVEELFDWVVIGTPVRIVRGGTPDGGPGDGGSGGAGERPVLSRGSRGPWVTELQTRLRTLGLYRGALDGIFGPLTEEAVREFQRSQGLVVDGIVGPATWSALDRV